MTSYGHLVRLKKEAKKGKKAKTKEAQGAAGAAGAASSAALGVEAVEGEHPETAEGEATAQGGAEGNAPQPVPNDPLNPLNAAYDMKAYALLRKLRLDEEHQISQVWDFVGSQVLDSRFSVNKPHI